jgi:hypothetical protein
MGYSLSLEESQKRDKYVRKVWALNDRFKKFGVEYVTGDRSEVYRPMVMFREYVGKKNYVVYLYLRIPITKATKVIKQMEDNIISREDLVKYAKTHGMNRVSEMPAEEK